VQNVRWKIDWGLKKSSLLSRDIIHKAGYSRLQLCISWNLSLNELKRNKLLGSCRLFLTQIWIQSVSQQLGLGLCHKNVQLGSRCIQSTQELLLFLHTHWRQNTQLSRFYHRLNPNNQKCGRSKRVELSRTLLRSQTLLVLSYLIANWTHPHTVYSYK